MEVVVVATANPCNSKSNKELPTTGLVSNSSEAIKATHKRSL
jgi:hypothetical protein